MHILDYDVEASDEFASDVVTHEVICVVDVTVLLELHSVCGDEVDNLDVTKGDVEDILMLVDPVNYLFFDVILLWRLLFFDVTLFL